MSLFDSLLLWLLVAIAKRFFGFVNVYMPDGETVKGLFFAVSERDMNTAIRTYVEELDKEYEN